MTIVLDLRPELEAALVAEAARAGVSVSEYVGGLIGRETKASSSKSTVEERVANWRAGWENLPPGPVLSDYAMSRESMYEHEKL